MLQFTKIIVSLVLFKVGFIDCEGVKDGVKVDEPVIVRVGKDVKLIELVGVNEGLGDGVARSRCI